MIPPTVDMELYQGDTFEIFIRARLTNTDGTPGAYVDLTGYTPTAQIRNATSDTLVATFACTLANQTTSPGGILSRLTPSITAALTPGGLGNYDIQVTNGTDTYTFLRGAATLVKEVTHA